MSTNWRDRQEVVGAGRLAGVVRPVVDCTGSKDFTRQSEKDSADINFIVRQFDRTGTLPQVSMEGLFLDVSDVGDYREALEQVKLADSFFMALPAVVRAEFGNDAAAFLDWASDPSSRTRLQELGMIPKDIVVPEPDAEVEAEA